MLLTKITTLVWQFIHNHINTRHRFYVLTYTVRPFNDLKKSARHRPTQNTFLQLNFMGPKSTTPQTQISCAQRARRTRARPSGICQSRMFCSRFMHINSSHRYGPIAIPQAKKSLKATSKAPPHRHGHLSVNPVPQMLLPLYKQIEFPNTWRSLNQSVWRKYEAQFIRWLWKQQARR